MSRVIVIGGGLSGLSAAHTVLENGGNVLILDKNAFLGGNSTKATSGINGALTKTQVRLGINDSVETFIKDTTKSARELARPELINVLVGQSGAAVEWLQDEFQLDLSLVARLGGHSFPRTHRGKERFPGMTITYALMERMEEISAKFPNRATVLTKATATKLLQDSQGSVCGVEFTQGGKSFTEYGPVIIASGGYGADFSATGIIAKYRPDLIDKKLATTNGNHCTGDGVKMALAVGANTADIEQVQVHPTGLVDPAEPNATTKFLAAEALRGVGGLLLDANGNRFCNELGHRDYVSGEMWKNKGPFRLVLNSSAAKKIEWHCKHYVGRGLMKQVASADALAQEMGISAAALRSTFDKYNSVARAENCPFGKKYFNSLPFTMGDDYHVAIVTPVVHYTMGGVEVGADSEVRGAKGVIPGLWAAGEVMGGTHGVNRLGGSSLLDCVVFGRVSGRSASRYLMQRLLNNQGGAGGAGGSASFNVTVSGDRVTIDIPRSAGSSSSAGGDAGASANGSSSFGPDPNSFYSAGGSEEKKEGAAAGASTSYTMEDVAKHTTDSDCWVVVNGQVLNATSFLDDHPGGKKAIMLYAGKDASEEFNMLHKPDVVEKYAPEIIIGTLKTSSKM